MRLVEYSLEGGSSIHVEVEEDYSKPPSSIGTSTTRHRSQKAFIDALGELAPALNELTRNLRKSLSSPPKQFTIELGVKLSIETGIVIAKTQGESNFKISLTWEQPS